VQRSDPWKLQLATDNCTNKEQTLNIDKGKR